MKKSYIKQMFSLILTISILATSIPIFATNNFEANEGSLEIYNIPEENIIDLNELNDYDISNMLLHEELTKEQYVEIKKFQNFMIENNIKPIDENIQTFGIGSFLTVNYIIIKKIAANKIVRVAAGFFTAQVASGVIKGVFDGDLSDHIANWIQGKKYSSSMTIEVDSNNRPIRSSPYIIHLPYNVSYEY